jgi:F0F1-type ATP synthase membrane subunit b/b'
MSSEALPQIVNFTAVVVFLGVFGRKPMQAFLSARSEGIKKLIDESESESKQVTAQLRLAEKNATEKEVHAKQLREDASNMVSRHKERALEAAKNESARIVKEGELLGAGELHKKKEALQQEISEKSVALAQKYLSNQLEGKDKEKLIAEYISLVAHGKA